MPSTRAGSLRAAWGYMFNHHKVWVCLNALYAGRVVAGFSSGAIKASGVLPSLNALYAGRVVAGN